MPAAAGRKNSLKRGGTMRVSRVENEKLIKCDQDDVQLEKEHQEKVAKLASTTSRFFSSVKPGWGIPLNMFLTVIIAPSMII